MPESMTAAEPRAETLTVRDENPARALLERVEGLCEAWAARPDHGGAAPPLAELDALRACGLMLAPFPAGLGGCGLGVTSGTQHALLRTLAAVGGADLALGRIVEGHVNALLLALRYGRPEQIEELARDVRDGALCGVWNTGSQTLLWLEPAEHGFRFHGNKTFCTGAEFVERPVVTADLPGRGWQMTMPRMSALRVSIDRDFWHPLGMERSASFSIDFTGTVTGADTLIGEPGDFYKDPLFRGGAIRFAAVQAGAVLALHNHFASWLERRQRGRDPYQLARLGELSLAAQQAVLWVERAAAVAEECFYRTDRAATDRMTATADAVRLAIESLAAHAMRLVTTGVGAQGLLEPHPFARIVRDLTMYLRQPAPDETLAAVGRRSVEAASGAPGRPVLNLWAEEPAGRSLPATYFERIYRERDDPWSFASSPYERDKYAVTLASLPRHRYANALEVGCSIGVLTRRLAERCDRLLGLDVAERALAAAEERCRDLPQVRFALARVPDAMPEDAFDLIVVSEVAYYWRLADLARAGEELAARHRPGGHLVLVHLTEKVDDYPLTGDQVHDFWTRLPYWTVSHSERHPRYRLDVLTRS